MLVVQAVTAVDPGQDDPVRGVGAGRGSVRDVDARRGAEVVPRTADTVLDTGADGGLESATTTSDTRSM